MKNEKNDELVIRNEMRPYMNTLISKWRENSDIPGEDELKPLTADEAEAVAIAVGYSGQDEFHTRVRIGCRSMSGEPDNSPAYPPAERFHRSDIQMISVHGVGRFEAIDGTIIRCRRGECQTSLHSTPWSEQEQELVSHVLRTVTERGRQQTCEWNGTAYVVVVHLPQRSWVIRHNNGSVYQIHPERAYGFAREKMSELLKKEERKTARVQPS